MSTRFGAVLLCELLFLACPAFAQRPSRSDSGKDRNEPKAWQADAAQQPAADWGARDPARLDRGRMIYTSRGAIFTHEFNVADQPPGWNHSRKVGGESCEAPGQAKKNGCRRSLLRRLLGRWLKRKGTKHRPPVIYQDPEQDHERNLLKEKPRP